MKKSIYGNSDSEVLTFWYSYYANEEKVVLAHIARAKDFFSKNFGISPTEVLHKPKGFGKPFNLYLTFPEIKSQFFNFIFGELSKFE